MNQQTKNRYVAVTQQIDRVRRIYSQIGQPLPAEIIIDLYRHLGAVMDQNQKTESKKRYITSKKLRN